MADIWRLVVENGDRMNELTQQAQRRVHLDRQQVRFCSFENCRQPHARDVVRHDLQARHRFPCPLHAVHAAEMLGLKISKPVRAIAKRRLDDRRLGQLVAKRQDFELISVDTKRQMALAKPVLEEGRTGRRNTRDEGIHE
jgi:hypothetical protein